MDEALRYDRLVADALRGVVRRALAVAQSQGLPGQHHFYITFRTGDAGVGMPEPLRARFPELMTIVLQHQFWDLEVDDDGFRVTLSFGGRPTGLAVPFGAVTAFADPAAGFALQFGAAGSGARIGTVAAGGDEGTAGDAADAGDDADDAAGDGTAGRGAEVVALDAFRNRG